MDLFTEQRPAPITVSQACGRVKDALSQIDAGKSLRVRGEIGQFRGGGASKHWYFPLLDEDGSKIECAFFIARRTLSGLDFAPEQGMVVVAEGHFDFYAPYGKLSFIVTAMEREGQGTLHERFEQLRRSLQVKGWFSDDLKRPLPQFAKRIAILTSASGAVRHDIERTAFGRWPGIELVLVPVPVQGEKAPAAIARAVRATHAAATARGFDALILARGGGSLEDLWAFNTEEVIEAIYECRAAGSQLPVVAAIGHESDTTLAELVADHRASTPTAAAVCLVISAEEQRAFIGARNERLRSLVANALDRDRTRIGSLARHLSAGRGRAVLAPFRQRLLVLSRRLQDAASPAARLAVGRTVVLQQAKRLHQAQGVRLERLRHGVEARSRQLKAIGPEQVLERGYSITTTAEGRVLRQKSEAQPGATIATRLAEGTLHSRVLPPEDEGE